MAQATTVGVKPGPINSMIFTKPVPNRMAQTGVRSGFYRGMVAPLPDPCLFRITEAYAKFNIEDRPLVTTMNMRPDKPLVESAFGLVQEGSVLSCQQPVLTTRYITLHRDAPPTPHLPLEGYDIKETLLAQTACDIFSNHCAEQVSKEHAV